MSIKLHAKRAQPVFIAAMGILVFLFSFPLCRRLEEASVTEGARSQDLSYILRSRRLGADRNILLTFFLTTGELNPTVSKVHVEAWQLNLNNTLSMTNSWVALQVCFPPPCMPTYTEQRCASALSVLNGFLLCVLGAANPGASLSKGKMVVAQSIAKPLL